MAFGEAVGAEALDLLEAALGEFGIVAAADHAAKAAEIVLTDQMHGPAGADLVGREIGDLKNRLS